MRLPIVKKNLKLQAKESKVRKSRAVAFQAPVRNNNNTVRKHLLDTIKKYRSQTLQGSEREFVKERISTMLTELNSLEQGKMTVQRYRELFAWAKKLEEKREEEVH
jgi:hypothetical protein